MANDLFNVAVARTGLMEYSRDSFPAGVVALAIDPEIGPALLTVGSIEYQYGRPDDAMEMLLKLTSLPEDEPDLAEIIDKAGDFLLDQEDFANALRLFQKATESGPTVTTYWAGLSYCLGKLGRKHEALAAIRQAVALRPDNATHLSDLGWTLVEAEAYEEAKTVLERAVRLAPPDYELPRLNLVELKKRMRRRQRLGRQST